MPTQTTKILTVLFALFRLTNLIGQTADTTKCRLFHDNTLNRDYYRYTDTPPSYKGSTELMFSYIRNHLVLPTNCEPGCHRLFAELIVEKDGSLTLIKFLKPDGQKELKDAFKKVITDMPKWTPATCDKKNVPAYFVIPFTIKVG